MSNKGDLTEAQKLLSQKIPDLPADDPLVELAAWNASLEQKVDDFGSRLDVWTNAILKQTDLATQQNQLIVSQNLTLQETAKNNAALGQTLLQFNRDLSQLQQEFKVLKDVIKGYGSALQHLNNSSVSVSDQLSVPPHTNLYSQVDSLSKKLTKLEAKLDVLPQTLLTKIEALNKKIDTLIAGLNSDRWITRSAFGILLMLVLGQYLGLGQWGNSLQSRIEQVNSNVNTALLRLKRLESR